MDTPLDWDLLHTFEAIARCGGLTAASHQLGVSQSTVSRQLAKLESLAGSPLFVRETPLRLTERGAALLETVAPMAEAALAARAALEQIPALRGSVSVSTVAELLRWNLIDALPGFYARYPELRLELQASNRFTSLAAGEADIALRFARPTRGELAAQRLQTIHYGYFAASCLDLAQRPPPWVGLTGSLAQIPDQRQAEAAFADRPPRLLVEDFESLAHATAAGIGVALLAHGLAERVSGLDEYTATQVGADPTVTLPTRELWLVVHRSRQRLPKVRAVMQWLVDVLS